MQKRPEHGCTIFVLLKVMGSQLLHIGQNKFEPRCVVVGKVIIEYGGGVFGCVYWVGLGVIYGVFGWV